MTKCLLITAVLWATMSVMIAGVAAGRLAQTMPNSTIELLVALQAGR
jgi:hypothetical protein